MKLVLPSIIKAAKKPNQNNTKIFIHIPKTGGTSFDAIVTSLVDFKQKSAQRLAVKDYFPPVLLKQGWIGAWPKESKVSAHYISGHFPFGAHQLVEGKSDYLVLIANPLKRELSNLNHHLERALVEKPKSIIEFTAEQKLLDSPQTRILAGVAGCAATQCTNEIYDQALFNLENEVLLVGILDFFDEFVSAVLGLYDWPAVAYVPQRVARNKAILELNAEEQEFLKQYHHFDFKLYSEAARIWESWKSKNIEALMQERVGDTVLCISKFYEKIKRYNISTLPLKLT